MFYGIFYGFLTSMFGVTLRKHKSLPKALNQNSILILVYCTIGLLAGIISTLGTIPVAYLSGIIAQNGSKYFFAFSYLSTMTSWPLAAIAYIPAIISGPLLAVPIFVIWRAQPVA